MRFGSLHCVLFALLVFVCHVPGFQKPDQPALPDVDQRTARQTHHTMSMARAAAESRLRQQVPGARVDFDAASGATRFVRVTGGPLTGAQGRGRSVSEKSLAKFAIQDKHRVTKAFLLEHQALFGHGPEALATARVKRDSVAPHNGLRTAVWEQQVDGIPVFDAILIAHTTRQGELVNISSQFIPQPGGAGGPHRAKGAKFQQAPDSSARRALVLAAASVGDVMVDSEVAVLDAGQADSTGRLRLRSASLRGDSHARRVWFLMNEKDLRLGWEVLFTSRARDEMFLAVVDVESGDVLSRQCLTFHQSAASYRVFTGESPTPLMPGLPVPVSLHPSEVRREFVTLAALSANASPQGWIDDGRNETLGNNVDAHLDHNGDDQPDLPRPHGSPFRVFDFPLDLTQSPAAYSNAAVVQVFYWCNWMHDRLYELGFTEAAGNLQTDNFGRGGLGGDALQVDVQDRQYKNNAFISVPPDGYAPHMQLFLFTFPEPDRDVSLDGHVVLHEYTHALSTRLVGGGSMLRNIQSRGLGEGWADFYGLALLSPAETDPDAVYPTGAYVTYQWGNLMENYYFGIRRFPYCTDLAKNPLTFRDIDPLQASLHEDVPINPVHREIKPANAANVHYQGEVWCMMLWEARANLILKHGFTSGNELMLQLVTDGLKLSPPNPNFIQARDAILQADYVNNAGKNQGELWAAFAKRGLGWRATSPPSYVTVGVSRSPCRSRRCGAAPSAGRSLRRA